MGTFAKIIEFLAVALGTGLANTINPQQVTRRKRRHRIVTIATCNIVDLMR